MKLKIAIPVNSDEILEEHFGQTKAFAFYQVENNTIIAKDIHTPPPHAPGVIPKWINQQGVNELLVSNMGERAKKILDYLNVNVHLGAPAIKADEIIDNFLAGQLKFNSKLCEHHHHHEHNQKHGHDHHNS